MNNIIWLASYPKSGNTWLRLFLTNLLDENDEPAEINKITSTSGIASSRGIFDELSGIEASDLSHDDTDILRPEVYKIMSNEAKKTLFVKVHDAYRILKTGKALFPINATKGVIYIVRNPLDLAVSYANHNNSTIEQSIKKMGDSKTGLCKGNAKLINQLRQIMFSWSEHVLSWINAENQNVHIMRYEDMKNKPLETFSDSVKFASLDFSSQEIEKALKLCSFEVLQKQEQEIGFREKATNSKSFFRKGKVGSWREKLNSENVKQLINDHKDVMIKFGYLTKKNEIIF